MRVFATVISGTLLLSVFTTGCMPKELNDEHSVRLSPSKDASDYQKEALVDGEVTREEYEEGFSRYSACMENIGYPLMDVVENNMQFDYSYPAIADEHGANECYFSEFADINAAWSMRPEVAELSSASSSVRACLMQKGIEPAETHAERLEQLIEHDVRMADCLD